MAGASTVLTNLTVLTTAGQIRFDHRSTRFDRRRPKAPGELRRGPIVGPRPEPVKLILTGWSNCFFDRPGQKNKETAKPVRAPRPAPVKSFDHSSAGQNLRPSPAMMSRTDRTSLSTMFSPRITWIYIYIYIYITIDITHLCMFSPRITWIYIYIFIYIWIYMGI